MNALQLIQAAVEPTSGPVEPGTSFHTWCHEHIPCEGDRAPLLINVRGVALAVSSSDRRYYNLEVRAPSGAALWFYGVDRNNGPLIAVEFKRNVKTNGIRAARIATAPDSIVHDATTPKEFLKALFSIKSRGASILERLVPSGVARAAAEPQPLNDMHGAGLSWWGSHKFFITRPKLFKVNGVELGAFGPPLVARHHLSIRAGASQDDPELRFTVRTIVRKRTIEVTYAHVAGNLQAEKMLCRVPEALVYPVRNEAELLQALCGIRDKRGNLVINKLINKPATAAVEPPAKFDVNGVFAALYDLIERKGQGTHRFVLGKHVICMNAISLHRNELPVAINVLAYETGNNLAACKYVLELKDSQIDLSSSNSAWARRYETGSAKQLLQQILKDIVEDMTARYAKAATRLYGG